MTTDPHAVVTEFCALWSTPNLDEIVGWFTEDAVSQDILLRHGDGDGGLRLAMEYR